MKNLLTAFSLMVLSSTQLHASVLCQADMIRPNDEVLYSFYGRGETLDVACPAAEQKCKNAIAGITEDPRVYDAECKISTPWEPTIPDIVITLPARKKDSAIIYCGYGLNKETCLFSKTIWQFKPQYNAKFESSELLESNGRCVKESTWGNGVYFGNEILAIWTKKGCEGKFKINFTYQAQ